MKRKGVTAKEIISGFTRYGIPTKYLSSIETPLSDPKSEVPHQKSIINRNEYLIILTHSSRINLVFTGGYTS